MPDNATSTVNRRQFMAISATTAAISTIASPALANPLGDISNSRLQIPAPSLTRLVLSDTIPSRARLLPHLLNNSLNNSLNSNPLSNPLSNPHLTITPLRCIEHRIAANSSITIEAYHPTPNLYSILLNTHNTFIPHQSIPDFASTTHTKAPLNSRGQTTLRITQRIGDASQSKSITINALASGTYLLGVPTANHSSNAMWRFTCAQLDNTGNIIQLKTPIPAASSRCAYFSITVTDKGAGE